MRGEHGGATASVRGRPGLTGTSRTCGVERRVVVQHERRDERVADAFVGDGVHRDAADVGMAQEDAFDRCGREVLAVHAQPVAPAAGVVEEPVGVEVAEVARPVPAVAHPLRRRGLVVVVARELAGPAVLTSSPTASSRLTTSPSGPKTAGGHSTPVSWCSTFTPSCGRPSAPGGVPSTREMITAFSVDPKPS